MKKNVSTLSIIVGFVFLNMMTICSQELKINNGISFTSVHNPRFDILNEFIRTYALSVGMDYCQHSFYEVSSEIGYKQRGGKENWYDNINNNEVEIKEKFDYLNFNTTFRLKYSKRQNCFYIGIGPKIDVLINKNNEFKDTMYEGYELSPVIFGMKPEVGFKMDLSRVLVGMNFSYDWDFNRFGKSDYINIRNNTFILSLSVGYKL